MYDARAVANFFIDRALSNARPITLMTLLKVLYFAHAWYLVKNDRALIAQPFEAWQYGPVNRVVYEQMRGQGAKPITSKLKSIDVKRGCFSETMYNFDIDIEKFLSDVFDYYTKFHAFALSDLTHEHGSPWDVIWTQAEKRAVPGMTIPNDLIKTWFRERGKVQGHTVN